MVRHSLRSLMIQWFPFFSYPAGLDLAKVTLGLPFYGRHAQGWTSYEDIVQVCLFSELKAILKPWKVSF